MKKNQIMYGGKRGGWLALNELLQSYLTPTPPIPPLPPKKRKKRVFI
jgi:hypothetical protein